MSTFETIGAVAGGINAIGGAVDTVAGFFGNSAADKARDDDWAKQKWLLNYNNFVNQRKRMEDAGLNPALMYGGGASSSSNAGSSPPSSRPSRMPSDNTGAIQAYIEYTMRDKQLQLNQANIDSMIAQRAQDITTSRTQAAINEFRLSRSLPSEALRTDATTRSITRGTDRSDALFPSQLQAADLHNKETKQRISNMEAEFNRIINDTTRLRLQNFEQELRNQSLDERIRSELNMLQAQIQSAALSGQHAKIQTLIEQAELDLRNKGASFKDSAVMRRLQQYGAALAEQFGY